MKSVYVQALGEWSSLGGPMLRGEAGLKLPLGFGVFGYGQIDRTEQSAGGGVRWTW